MKDLALPDHLPALRAAGVSCFKIEGRKKSPLYVATTTDYYRKLLDGRLDPDERPDIEADLQTVFSRPWTRLFVQSHKDKEVADRDTVGHRGTLIGKVDRIVAVKGGETRLALPHPATARSAMTVCRSTCRSWANRSVSRSIICGSVGRGKDANAEGGLRGPADSLVEVGLPPDHPLIPPGAPVYCSSSQAVKQKYRHERPKPGSFRVRKPVRIKAVLAETALTVIADVRRRGVHRAPGRPVSTVQRSTPWKNRMRSAFDTSWQQRHSSWRSLTFTNKAGGFVPVSRLNRVAP